MANKPRDTYKYLFKKGSKILHIGITNDLDRRENEHKQKCPNGHIFQVGRKTTEEAARLWEEEEVLQLLILICNQSLIMKKHSCLIHQDQHSPMNGAATVNIIY